MIASRRLYLTLVGLILISLCGYFVFWAVKLVAFLNLLLLLIVLIDFSITENPRCISAVRLANTRLSIGRANNIVLQIHNLSIRTLQMVIRDEYPQALPCNTEEFSFTLPAHEQASLVYALYPKQRGAYYFGDIHIRYLSRLGFFWRQTKTACRQETRVYSDLKALEELSVRLAHSSELGELKVRKRGQGTDFSSLRDYVPGDDIRTVDWKATARRERPVVRVYEVEKEQTLMILLDAGRMMLSELDGLRRFDHAMNAALALALAGLTKGDQVGFGIFAERPLLYLPPKRGKNHLHNILERTCDIQPKMIEPDYLGALSFFATAHKTRSLIVVLTDLTDSLGSETLLNGLAKLSPRHLPFCVTLRDKEIDKIAGREAESLTQIYRKAVSLDLLAQRELAFSHLLRRGCYVLDSSPADLSNKLIEKYIEIKERGRL